MNEIKYIWTLTPPSRPQAIQIWLFMITSGAVSFYFWNLTLAVLYTLFVCILAFFKPQIIGELLFYVQLVLFGLIFILNLLALAFVYFLVLWPLKPIKSVLNLKNQKDFPTAESEKIKRISYFEASKPIVKNDFLTPY